MLQPIPPMDAPPGSTLLALLAGAELGRRALRHLTQNAEWEWKVDAHGARFRWKRRR